MIGTAVDFTATVSLPTLEGPLKSMLPYNSNPVAAVKAAWSWLIDDARLGAFAVSPYFLLQTQMHSVSPETIVCCLSLFVGACVEVKERGRYISLSNTGA